MGIQIEFNPDLALRHRSEFLAGRQREEECLPELLEEGCVYQFLKIGQRNYWLCGEIPLLETKGEQVLSRPLASIVILEAMHVLQNGEMVTRGKYKVVEVFRDEEVHFDGFAKRPRPD